MPFLSPCYTWSSKYLKSAFVNNFRFYTNKCTHLLKTSNFGPKGTQNAALQQRYSPCYSKKPNFSGEIENNLFKNQIFPQNFLPEWFGPKQIEAICFQNGFHDNSAKTDCSKLMWIPILKGLKHLNNVIMCSWWGRQLIVYIKLLNFVDFAVQAALHS